MTIPHRIIERGIRNALKLNADKGEGRRRGLPKLADVGLTVIIPDVFSITAHIIIEENVSRYPLKKMTLSAQPVQRREK